MPMPVPAPNKVASAQPAPAPAPAPSKPMPAPLTSGVIAQPLPIVPGSAEPMTPVRVKTVQIKSGQTRVASAAPAPAPAPAATASLPPARTDVAETSSSVVAKAAELPPQNPKYGTGQGILGTLPASALQQHSQTMAYADPARPAATQPIATPPQPAAAPPQPAASASKARSGWIIQVGALQSESEAKQRLDAARSAASVLGKADPFTEEVSKGGKSFYRARFAGLDKDSAETACRTLKRNEISCIAIRN